ncbi:MAG TPA: ABC transporter ATP-binding protein [Miltoncostaeaceae bacterium]|nr:ABC transporter ATP-binding protein [Miltoncostaeaceae bacterium]
MAVLRLDITVPLRHFALDVALEVGEAETVALVGPSGAGKTTVLRAIAGAVRPRAGRITLGGATLFDAARRIDRPPESRRVGYVFQEYALFPHMTVRQNVAFAGRARAEELLERFGIAHLAGARPRRLSGGERQRVGLARAIASDPAVLLFDEPLSALDAHTRARVRAELFDLLRELRLPALLVTHDFEDAAALADRVGVIVDGRIHQTDTPAGLLRAPADAFVASFVGSNLMPGVARTTGNGLAEVVLEQGAVIRALAGPEGAVGAVVHPWDVVVDVGDAADPSLNRIRAPIASVAPSGSGLRVRIGPIVAEVPAAGAGGLELTAGRVASATFAPGATRLVALNGGRPGGEAP